MRHFTVPLAGSSLPKVDRIKGKNALEKKEAIRLTLAEIRRHKKIASMKLASGDIASASEHLTVTLALLTVLAEAIDG